MSDSVGEIGIRPEAVRREVWRSLVSLLRSYANAAALNGGEFTVTEPDSDSVLLVHQGRELKVYLNFTNGAADWRLSRRGRTHDWGEFEMSEDGAFHVGGEEKQLDQAAIEWVEALAKTPARAS